MAKPMDQYDTVLLGILQNEGKINDFLDVILGFLYRKTDFFLLLKNENDRAGFPPGEASKILQNSFRKFERLATQRRKEIEDRERKHKQTHSDLKENGPTHPKTPAVDARGGGGDQAGAAAGDKSAAEPAPTGAEVPAKEQLAESLPDLPAEQPMPGDQAAAPKPSEIPAAAALNQNEAAAGEKTDKKQGQADGKEEDDDPELTAQQKVFQSNPETYNGADRGVYKWSQSIMELDVQVRVPETIRKGSMVQVQSEKKHLKVAILGADKQWQTLVDGALTWEVKTDAFWSLEPGKHILLCLEKQEERWWEALLVGEPKINTRKIDCSRPMSDLDDEAQAKIEELVYNQNQKRLGLPQSHEQKTYKLLKDAWDAPGSPFAGQPFDPSKLSVDSSGVVNMK